MASNNAVEEFASFFAAAAQPLEQLPRVTDAAEYANAEQVLSERAGSWVPIPQASGREIRSCILFWNGRWISGDRFARDYATGIQLFDAEVTQSVARFHPAQHCPEVRNFETHALVWASVLVSFDGANFRDHDRDVLLAALLAELRPIWCAGEPARSIREAAILERATVYLAVRDRSSAMTTARSVVRSYLSAVGLPGETTSRSLARHLWALFGYRVCRDVHRLGVAARLRTAAVRLAEGGKPVQR